ncbi:hypothetical protein [Bacillus changyiensis]|uniref:hypothetical protein n=1 Tax=Bacillus changyiensis TaxID=3004103 RepID=UPI0022E715A2|nr:hypothetical protein [Bacillus changyiensis]MDA1476237.1 hypothetical protein [Bacillus changyiensis]
MRKKAFVSLSLFCSLFTGAFMMNKEMNRENIPQTGKSEVRQYPAGYVQLKNRRNKRESFKPREYIKVERR